MTSLVICLCWDACGQLRRERVLGSAVQLLAPSIGTRVRAVTRAPTSGTAQELIRASQRLGEGGFNPLNSLENAEGAASRPSERLFSRGMNSIGQ